MASAEAARARKLCAGVVAATEHGTRERSPFGHHPLPPMGS
jgi:hypothetical protein